MRPGRSLHLSMASESNESERCQDFGRKNAFLVTREMLKCIQQCRGLAAHGPIVAEERLLCGTHYSLCSRYREFQAEGTYQFDAGADLCVCQVDLAPL